MFVRVELEAYLLFLAILRVLLSRINQTRVERGEA